MMKYIRNLVYKMGFRPKPRTILYSPSAAYHIDADKAVQAAVKEMETLGNVRTNCMSKNCWYIGTHVHSHVCDFVCSCEKGQNFSVERE